MPLTPGTFRGPSIQPVAPGRTQAQQPNVTGSSKKSGHLLRDLENTKLEGDPLTLYGNAVDVSLDYGDTPVSPGATLSVGYRLGLYGGRAGEIETAIGVHQGGGLWFQVPFLGEDVPYFDVYRRSETSVLRMLDRAIGSIILWPYLLVGEDDAGTILPTSPLHVRGPIAVDVEEVDQDGEFEQFWGFYIADATAASFTLTLPDPSIVQGRGYELKRINAGANTVSVDVDGGGTIDGAASKSLDTQYAAIGLRAGPNEWHILYTFGTVT